MSLRSEYHYSYVSEGGDYIVTAYHRPSKDQEPQQIGEQARVPMDEVDDVGEKLISAHMERVTRMLEGGVPPENGEATDMTTLADHLAHKADHDNQCERDLEP